MQEIVIKIPWKVADAFINDRANHMQNKALRDALREGKVLPKGHDRLIYANEELYQSIRAWVGVAMATEILEKAPTIIEADKGEWK